MKKTIIIISVILVSIYFLSTMFFCLDERNMILVLRFGRPVRTIVEAGLHFKMPDPIEKKVSFDRRLRLFDPTATEYLTKDKQNIVVDLYICWKISDPLIFLQSLRSKEIAEIRLEDIIRSNAGEVFGSHYLEDFITTEAKGPDLDIIMKEITMQCNEQTCTQFGITVVDARIKRFNFPEDNLPSVYSRMWAERERIAKKYRAEGHKESRIIMAQAEKEARIIISEAQKESEIIKGRGDARAMEIYSNVYRKDPKFYKFIRTLESYKKFLDENTTIVLPGDSPLLELLEKGPDH